MFEAFAVTWSSLNMSVASPEILLLGAALMILLLDIPLGAKWRQATWALTVLSLLCVLLLLAVGQKPFVQNAFNGMFVLDPVASVTKIAMVLCVFLMLMYGRSYMGRHALLRGEFFTLVLLGLLGMMVMASGNHFVTLYVGLELLALSLYTLVAMSRDSALAIEAAMKYFVLGALASGLLLFGMSLVYAGTGSLGVVKVASVLATGAGNRLLVDLGLVFMVAGMAFKLGAVPFHMWVPDVYEGAPTPVVQLVSSAPKLAAFAFVFRLLVEALGGFLADWRGMLVILAVLSLGVGNLVALAQTNIKRMLAYSTISHMGFLLLGLLVGSQEGYASALTYALIYAFMAAATFGIIMLMSSEGDEVTSLDDMRGLSKRNPWLAAMMLILMLSMAGIPPFAGFFAKFVVLRALLTVPGMIWLAVLAVLFSLIGAFYYLRVVKLMYFDEPMSHQPASVRLGLDTGILISVNCLALLALGVLPESLLKLVARTIQFSLTGF